MNGTYFLAPRGPGLLKFNTCFSNMAITILSPQTGGKEECQLDSGLHSPECTWTRTLPGLAQMPLSASTETGKLLQGMTGYSSLSVKIETASSAQGDLVGKN